MLNKDDTILIKLDCKNKDKVYNLLVSKVKDTLKTAKSIALISLGSPYYANRILNEYNNIKEVNIFTTKELKFIYEPFENNKKIKIWYVDNEKEPFKSYVNMEKFDCVIMNPPYDGNKNLYGKLTLEAKMHAKEVVCLSPYLNYLNNSQKKSNHEVANKLMPFLNSYELIDSKTFDACFDKKLCVFHFVDNPTNHPDVNEIYWREFSNPVLAKSIITKMTNYFEHCYSHIINKNEFDNYSLKVAFSGIRGHRYAGIPSWDWTTLLDEEKMVNFTLQSNSKGDLMGFPFESEIECKHFVKYVMSDIFEYMILVQKNSMNTDKWLFKLIPYMPTYEKEWTDVEIAKEIGLTTDELNYIYDEMKNYGWKTKR